MHLDIYVASYQGRKACLQLDRSLSWFPWSI